MSSKFKVILLVVLTIVLIFLLMLCVHLDKGNIQFIPGRSDAADVKETAEATAVPAEAAPVSGPTETEVSATQPPTEAESEPLETTPATTVKPSAKPQETTPSATIPTVTQPPQNDDGSRDDEFPIAPM